MKRGFFFLSAMILWVVTVRAAGLKQEAYIWQRDWNPSVCEAVRAHGTNFDGVAVLAAEVNWMEGKPRVTRVAVNYAVLTNLPVCIVLRIGPFPGPFKAGDETTHFLAEVSASLIGEAWARGMVELQIDFDCAESNLAGYRVWLTAIQQRVAPVPVTITVLPAWLKREAFGALAHAASNYVLQVHSLERPTIITAPFTLCDPAAARRAVTAAGQLGVPFRVALPTYGYLLAFDHNGKFFGLSAESRKDWPEGTQVREVRTDPVAMAGLVQGWLTNRPPTMQRIIWYRFPVPADTLNLRWPTLRTMMAGQFLREHVSVETREVEPGLVEVYLVNDGDIDFSSGLTVLVRWSKARLVAGDGLRDFDLSGPQDSTATLKMKPDSGRLMAGEKRLAGWLRFDRACEVASELQTN